MKKIFRKIHLYLAIPFGLVISIICLSGAILVFENEVMELCRHDLYYVKKVGTTPLPIDRLMTKVADTLPDSVSVTGVNISSEPEKAYRVNLSKPRRASIYVDQYTGEIKGKNERAPFFVSVFKLHRWLLDSAKPDGGIFWGKIIVGTSTLVFIVALITGILIWLPRTGKILKKSLKISLSKGWRRFYHNLHVAGGVYATLFLLAMALTGLTWSFPWYRTAFYTVFGVEVKKESPHKQPDGKSNHSSAENKNTVPQEHEKRQRSKQGGRTPAHREEKVKETFAHWQQVYERLYVLNPDYKQIGLSDGSASVSFEGFGNQRASDRYAFNPKTGEIIETTLYKSQDKSSKIRGWIYSVHVGNWGGMVTRILAFLTSLLGGTLPLTGYYLWIKKRNKKRTSNFPRSKIVQ